jgi:glyoxylase-like metal-dependent hydrolase (beta-lactamase superfamily II)
MIRKPGRNSIGILAGLLALAFVAGIVWWRRFLPPSPDAAATPEAAPAVDQAESPRLAPISIKIADGIYMIGELLPATVYVVDTSDGLVMIDSGLEAEYDKLTQGMARLGLDLSRLKMILLTHVHGDHTMGARRLRRETGAKIYIGQEDALPLRQGGPWEAIFSKFEMDGVETHPTEIDGELVDGQVLTLGDARFSCIATPGHTPGSFCFLLKRGPSTALFTGDTIMTLNDGQGTYATYLPPKYRGDLDAYLATLRQLGSLPMPDLVLPGHPRSDPSPQNPRLTPDRWKGLLDHSVFELEQLSARYAADGADFLDGEPKQLAAGLFYLGDFDQRACYALVSQSRSLLFDAPGGEAAADLLDAVWRRLAVEPPPLAAVLLTSCRSANVSGLGSIVARFGCRVVASSNGIDAAKRLCPADTVVLSADDLSALGWEGLEALPLAGLDETAVAYHFRRGDAVVLVSDSLPIEGDGGAMARSREAQSQPANDWKALHESLLSLERIQPNLWLSAAPLHGRNANLYGDDWPQVIRLNVELLRRARAQPFSATMAPARVLPSIR